MLHREAFVTLEIFVDSASDENAPGTPHRTELLKCRQKRDIALTFNTIAAVHGNKRSACRLNELPFGASSCSIKHALVLSRLVVESVAGIRQKEVIGDAIVIDNFAPCACRSITSTSLQANESHHWLSLTQLCSQRQKKSSRELRTQL